MHAIWRNGNPMVGYSFPKNNHWASTPLASCKVGIAENSAPKNKTIWMTKYKKLV